MKSLFILVFSALFFDGSAQSLYRARTNSQVSYVNKESFTTTFEHSFYGITFKQNDRNLNNELKASIRNFIKKTNVSKFKKFGTIELEIIKREQIYYVFKQKKLERLLELEHL
jgi:hypothetical protein